MAVTKRGKASVEGIPGAFDVIVYPVKQTGKLTHQWEEEKIGDEHAADVAILARNEHMLADFGMKILGDTQAHAVAGAALLSPLATVTLSGFDLAAYNGKFQYVGGAELDLNSSQVGSFNIKLRRWADGTQNDLLTSTPS
jgi:hypothetical protein